MSKGIPKGIHVSPHSFIAVDDKTKNVYLFTLNPPKKQLVWRLPPRKSQYGNENNDFSKISYLRFGCKFIPDSYRLFCEAIGPVGGDDYPMYFVSLDLIKQQVYYSPFLRDYEEQGGLSYRISRDILAVMEINDGSIFYVFRLPDLKSLLMKNVEREDNGNYYWTGLIGVSQKGSYILQCRDNGKKRKYRIYNIKKKAFKDFDSPLQETAVPTGFVNDRRILFLDENKGYLVDIEGKEIPTTAFDLPPISSSMHYDLFIKLYRYYLFYQRSNEDVSMPEVLFIFDSKKGTLDHLDINLNEYHHIEQIRISADTESLLIQAFYVVNNKGHNDWYLWESRKLKNVTDKVNKLLGDMELWNYRASGF